MKIYDKLVRDRITKIIKNNRNHYEVALEYLYKKLNKEVAELLD